MARTRDLRCLRALSLAVLLTLTAGAHADDAASPAKAPAYRLTWSAPAPCPAARDVAARIDQLLSTSTIESASQLVAVVRVSANADGGFDAELNYALGEAENVRGLAAPTCETLAAAAALIIATAVDPTAAQRALELEAKAETKPEPKPVEEPKRPSLPPPKASTSDSRPTRPHRPLRWSLAALGWGGLNVMPNLAWGFGAALGLSRPPFTLGLDGQLWGTQRQPSAARSTAGADFQRYSGGLRGCYRLSEGKRLELDGCVGAELLVLQGEGFGVTERHQGSQTWLAPLFGPSVGIRLTRRLQLLARGELSFPIVRHDFVLGGVGFVYRLPPVGERLGLGVAATF